MRNKNPSERAEVKGEDGWLTGRGCCREGLLSGGSPPGGVAIDVVRLSSS
jgi:hypothetical protein